MERLETVVLAWLGCLGNTSGTAKKASIALKKLLPASDRELQLATALDALARDGVASRTPPATKKGSPQYTITPSGRERAAQFLNRSAESPCTKFAQVLKWDLPAIAVGMKTGTTPAEQKATAKMIPLAICARRFKLDILLPLDLGIAKLELVKFALARFHQMPAEKIYLKKLPGGEMPALVVAPLLNANGTAATNLDRLIEATALSVLGVTKVSQIGVAAVQKWMGEGRVQPESSADPKTDLDGFCREITHIAQKLARDGSDGLNNLGDEILTDFVWQKYRQNHPDTSHSEFQRRLSDSNGKYISLVREDMIFPEQAEKFRASEIRTGAAVYHYLRINKQGNNI